MKSRLWQWENDHKLNMGNVLRSIKETEVVLLQKKKKKKIEKGAESIVLLCNLLELVLLKKANLDLVKRWEL